jgi:hypothetical protein
MYVHICAYLYMNMRVYLWEGKFLEETLIN